MATRIEPAVYAQLEEKVAGLQYHPAICAIAPAAIKPSIPALSVLSAGTADLSVAEEAAVTAEPRLRAAPLGCGRCWYPPLAE